METAAAPSGDEPVQPDRLRAPAEEPGELQEVSGKYWWPLILAHLHNRNEIWRVRSNALITSYVREQDDASEARASILNILASSPYRSAGRPIFSRAAAAARLASVPVCWTRAQHRHLHVSGLSRPRPPPCLGHAPSLSRPRPPLPALRLVSPPPPEKSKRTN